MRDPDENHWRTRDETLHVPESDLERLLVAAKRLQSATGFSFRASQESRRKNSDMRRKMAV
jgi:hypothetical protein